MLKSRGKPVDNPRVDIYSSRPRQTAPSTPCPGGEIGRHASFRCWWPKGRGGSSPLLGTIFKSLDSDIVGSPIKCLKMTLYANNLKLTFYASNC